MGWRGLDGAGARPATDGARGARARVGPGLAGGAAVRRRHRPVVVLLSKRYLGLERQRLAPACALGGAARTTRPPRARQRPRPQTRRAVRRAEPADSAWHDRRHLGMGWPAVAAAAAGSVAASARAACDGVRCAAGSRP